MFTKRETQAMLSAISNMQESRVGGWINNNELNNKLTIGANTLVELIDKKLMEAGGMYSRLTRYGRDTLRSSSSKTG